MIEGNSARIVPIDDALKSAFKSSSPSVLKEFKKESDDGAATIADFRNEVQVLKILERYKADLPFSIPRVLDSGEYPREDKDADPAFVAFIKMTKLSGGLHGVHVKEQPENLHICHAVEAAKALAALHALTFTQDEKALIRCSPVTFNVEWLGRHHKTPALAARATDLAKRLQAMEGDEVFVHNDFHHKNLFAKSYGEKITGVCDFCCSGFAAREIDFYPFLGDPVVENAFLSAYAEASGAEVSLKNIAIVRDLRAFIKDYSQAPATMPHP